MEKNYEEREYDRQYEVRKRIKEQKLGCWYCAYFGQYLSQPRCHTAAWRGGTTCELFSLDTDKR